MNFSYQALDPQGQVTSGLITAESRELAANQLRARGFFPTEITPIKNEGVVGKHWRFRGEDLALFAMLLADLLQSGLPLDRALKVLVRQGTNARVRQVTRAVLHEVEAGSSLADALEAQGFPVFFTQMVRAGEQSGQLEQVLGHLATHLRKEAERLAQVRAALVYPLLLFGAAVAALLFLLVFLVPQMSLLFQDFGQSLPWSTALLVRLGEGLTHGWPVLLALVLGGICLGTVWLKLESGRRTFEAVVLRLPLLGPVLLQSLTARFARTLAILLRGGVPLLACFPLLEEAVANSRLKTGLAQAREQVREGETLATALGEGILPPMALEILAVGEEGGNLEGSLTRIASIYEFQADTGTKRLLSLIEPLIILGMGLVVAFVITSILLPLFDLNTGMGQLK